MAEKSAVRLVRCPNCENLLPELPGYSVYQCGGCGAVLRAKNENVEADTFSQKSDEERVGGVSEKFSEKKPIMNLSDGSENDTRSNDKYRKGVMIDADNRVVENDMEINPNINEPRVAKMTKEFEDLKPLSGNSNPSGSRRSERMDLRSRERADFGDVRYSTPKYSEEGPSNYQMGSSYGYADPMKNRNDPDGFNKVEYLEQDRAELLRKLDELKDQISRTRDAVEKPKENVPLDRRVFKGSSSEFNWASMQYPIPDQHAATAPYVNHYAEPSFPNRNEMGMHGFYHPSYNVNRVQGFGDPFRSQMLGRAPTQSHQYFSGQYMDGMGNMGPFDSYSHNLNLHPPSCSCFHCYNKHKQFNPPNNPMFYHHDEPGAFGSRGYNPRFSNPPPLSSQNPQSHVRWPSDFNSEGGGIIRHRPQRVVLVPGERRCRPLAGGAPFVTCYNCFELLQLPKKVFLEEKNQKKIKCAACSTVVFFTVANMKLLVNRTPSKGDDVAVVNVGGSHTRGYTNWASTDFSSDEYDNSGYDFQSMDQKVIVSSSTGQGLGSNKSEDMRSLHSTSSCTSEDEGSLGSLIGTRKESHSAELPIRTKPSPPPRGSPLQDHIDYSNKYNAADRLGKGNQSGRSERENVIPKKATSRQSSMKDVAVATEIEIPSNEYSNTGTSQDSGEELVRIHKGGESSLVNIIKKSFRDFSRSSQTVEQGKPNVIVNGHLIHGRLVKKAEKLAGPIQPGEYWYDFRAGFWGVMGGPGLGIIPPFIEEFNYPMPENCAAGNTGVFVNGRELNQKDLDLLGSRGLPKERDRSYILEISGRVLDEDTGEELDSLGKLAPTVEKVKHGFGMKVRRAATTA